MINAWLPIQHLDKPPITVAGLCYFYFTPKENVLLWPSINPLTGGYTDDIVLKEGKTWYRCQVIDKDRSYTEEQKESNAGPFMQCQLTGFLPDDLPGISLSVNRMKYHEFLIVMKERNGIMRLVGGEDAAADFSYSYSSADSTGTRGRKLVFNWQSEDTAALYLTAVSASGDIIVPPWVPPGSDNGSSGSNAMVLPVTVELIEGQTDYTLPELVNNELILVGMPPGLLSYGSLQNQYTYTKETGTIHLNYSPKGGQEIVAIYSVSVTDGSGKVLKNIQMSAVAGQSDYTRPELVNKDLVLVGVPPVLMFPGTLQDQYRYTKSTGTIHFNYRLDPQQNIIVLYNE